MGTKKPITITSKNAHHYLNQALDALNRSVKPVYKNGYIGKLADVVYYRPQMSIPEGIAHRATMPQNQGNLARVRKLKLKYDKEKDIYSTNVRRPRATKG